MTLRRRGPMLVVVAAVALAIAVTAGFALRGARIPGAAASTTAPVTRGTVSVTASAAGTVAIVQTRGLSFTTSAVVTELNVKVGDQVSAGQVLARIDGTDAQNAVSSAQQQVSIAQTNLAKAQAPTPTCAAAAPAALLLPGASASAPPGVRAGEATSSHPPSVSSTMPSWRCSRHSSGWPVPCSPRRSPAG